jgi:3-hydroxyisobutyrate dehydrogenase-like beta-hydroxyacid dehydrogenase
MTALGFIGLGTMGSHIVRRLLAAGHPVAGYNRTAAKAQALVDAGMRLCASPREVVESSEIIFSMVADTNALRALAEGEDGVLAGLSPGKVYVDMSTVSPSLSRELARRASERGAQMLDAPVSGSVPAVDAGTLIFFVGGDVSALERARPIFELLSQKIIHVGGSGEAITIKIAINLNLAIQLVALYEGLLLAEKSGISRATALDALLNSVIASPAMKYRAPLILKLPDEVWFSVAMMQKDLQIALDLGEELGVPLRSVELSRDVLAEAQQLGYGDEDFAALFEVIKRQAGVE